MSPVIVVERLRVEFTSSSAKTAPVRDVSFEVEAGETLCIVGESGSGKSLTSLAIMDLLPSRGRRYVGRLDFCGEALADATPSRMRALRGDRLSMIFQDPTTALNPLFTIGNQMVETWQRHRGGGGRAAREKAVTALERVGIAGAGDRLHQFPHQLSGGLRQRVMIAMALLCEPQLVIADEPTTALDVTVQAQILALLGSLQRDLGMALVLITHDLGVVSQIADHVAVMYAGQVVEAGRVEEVLERPQHPYTRALMDCLPDPSRPRLQPLGTIPGMVPSRIVDGRGCTFADRCAVSLGECHVPPIIPLYALPGSQRSRCIRASSEFAAGVPIEAMPA